MLNVSNFEVSEAFYDRFLLRIGFTVDYREQSAEWSGKSYRLNDHNLWIKSQSGEIHPFVRSIGLDHVAFFVDSKGEVDEIYDDLRSINTQITRPPSKYPEYSPQYYAFYFRDPDNIPLEIAFS